MEYLLGSVVTLVTMLIVSKNLKKSIQTNKINSVVYSQIQTYEKVKGYLPSSLFQKPKGPETQLSKHEKSMKMRVIFVDDLAYWIKDGTFFVAKIENGFVNQESARAVDTMGMDKVELDRMSFIVEKLTEEL